jgi:hypothetical protein
MSDYHIIDGDIEGGGIAYIVAFHISVPDENNKANINYRACLSQDPKEPKVSLAVWINQTHKDQLTNGEIYEVVKSYTRKVGNTPLQDQAALDTIYSGMITTVQDKLKDRYRYWGFDRDVP